MSTFRQTGRVNSRTGCKTCKIRRVKCGEEKPHCRRCSSTGRRCDYQLSYQLSVIPRILPTPSPETRQRRAFEFYYFHAAPCLSDSLDLDFWRGTVLQICGSEPAVWDAIVALSTLYEHPPPVGKQSTYRIEDTDQLPPPRSERHQEALGWYSRSLNRIQEQIQRGLTDYTVALLSCVLFVCIEILQGNVKNALTLYEHGARLLGMAGSTSQLKTIMPVFLQFETFAVIVKGVEPVIERPFEPYHAGTGHATLSDARTALYTLAADWKIFDCDGAVVRSQTSVSIDYTLHHRQTALEGALLTWYRQFLAMPEVIKSTPKSTHQGVIATLLMTYKSILILTRTGLSMTETCYDAHDADFADIISHAPAAHAATITANGKQPPFTFDMGPGMALFITVFKCRSPSIRRQALRFLRQAPRMQGMYGAVAASDFLAAVVAVEESGSSSSEELSFDSLLARPGRIPSDRERIFYLQPVPWQNDQGETRTALKYSRRDVIDGEMKVFENVVVLPSRCS